MTPLLNKKILVTGGQGFLGKHLVSQLKEHYEGVSLYTQDIRDLKEFEPSFDIVYHLAAITKPSSALPMDEMFDVNVSGTISVLRYCKKIGSRCIFASSSSVYEPTCEDKVILETASLNPVTPYGYSKMLAENVCEYFSKNLGVPITIFRIFNLYGVGQKSPFLVPTILDDIQAQRSSRIERPNAVRDFIYVTDVVQAFMCATRDETKGLQVYNVGTGQGNSVKNVERFLSGKTSIRPNHSSQNAQKDYVIASIQKIKKKWQWVPRINLQQGVNSLLKEVECR